MTDVVLQCIPQWPSATHSVAGDATEPLYVRVIGADQPLEVEIGFGPADQPPESDSWRWSPAARNPECCDGPAVQEYTTRLTPTRPGEYRWTGRARLDGGEWALGAERWSAAEAPRLTVTDPAPVCLVTLNLRCLLDQWELRRPLIAAELARLDPDLIGLQEVCAEPGGRDNLLELAEELELRTGRRRFPSRRVTHWSWDAYEEGLALLTTDEPREVQAFDLPSRGFPRQALAARVGSPAGQLTFVTTHLDHRHGRARREQIRAVIAALEGFGGETNAQVITGDLNEGPDGGGEVFAELTAAGWRDLWAELHPDEPGPTFPAAAPTSRLDSIWLRPRAAPMVPTSIARFLDRSAGGITGSDHLGLITTLSR